MQQHEGSFPSGLSLHLQESSAELGITAQSAYHQQLKRLRSYGKQAPCKCGCHKQQLCPWMSIALLPFQACGAAYHLPCSSQAGAECPCESGHPVSLVTRRSSQQFCHIL